MQESSHPALFGTTYQPERPSSPLPRTHHRTIRHFSLPGSTTGPVSVIYVSAIHPRMKRNILNAPPAGLVPVINKAIEGNEMEAQKLVRGAMPSVPELVDRESHRAVCQGPGLGKQLQNECVGEQAHTVATILTAARAVPRQFLRYQRRYPACCFPVPPHRILINFKAEAEGVT